jgi:hypothetical protein
MNLTLSVDERLVQKMRILAAKRGTSLNQMIREYMEEATASGDPAKQADEFARLAKDYAGKSPKGFHFDREEAHHRGTSR